MALDLHRHAVLEASAGTGKTHAIGELVLRLLKEGAVPLERILIVTYTEKATGELKSRLRSTIEKELNDSPPHRELLQKALDEFDQAWIFTIHGFCRRVLQEYPIEQGQDLRSELVGDEELLEPCLRELQRRVWRAEYGEFLDEVLEISGYDRQQAGAWEKRVRELARRFRPECGEQLRPALDPDWPARLANLRGRFLKTLPLLRNKLPSVHWNRRLKRIKDYLEDPETYARPLVAFHRLVCELHNKGNGFSEAGFPSLLPEELAILKHEEGEPHVDAASAVVHCLERIHKQAAWATFRHQLAARTVHQLQNALADFKRQHGQWSFNDMIARVDEGLDPARNPRAAYLTAELRGRFRCGIVDEFQDTDPLQWRILRRVFLTEVEAPEAAEILPFAAAESRAVSNPLILVGDPKQAIFGFRGADLPTYLAAKREMLTLQGAQDHPLVVNWRSTPEMLRALNRLFHQENWFPAASGLDYRPVEAPREEERPNRLEADRTGRAALNVVDWTCDEPLAKLRRWNARFIVREIERLLAGTQFGRTMISIRKGPARPIHAGDICILVFRRSEANPLIAALGEAGIPYSFYKQPALWQSDEAQQIRYVLEALSQPEHEAAFRKALLTRFFRISAEDLAVHEDIPAGHPARQRFDAWLELAGRRQWAGLFQSMLEDTGLFFHDLFASDADRKRANLRHLAATLMQRAYRENLDLLGLVELCRQLEQIIVSDENVQPKETEEPRVQITTIHASKGLEFPIVFLAGGWTEGNAESLLSYRTKEGLVYDLSDEPTAAAEQAADRDKLDEQRRLLYVALTRAMFKLYVPLVREVSPKYKREGPLVKLLAPALNRAQLQMMDAACAAKFEPDLRTRPLAIYREPEPEAAVATTPTWQMAGPLFPSLDTESLRRGIVIRSFSSLRRAGHGSHRLGEASSFAAEVPRVEDEEADSRAALEEVKDPLRGAVFGEIVHGVLEKIDFEAVARAATYAALLSEPSPSRKLLAEVIDYFLPSLPARLPEEELRNLCRERVADLVWRALRTPLDELGGPLCRIPSKDRLHELQFHFPEEDAAALPREERFMTGIIDLVVRRQNRYYLLDWKTNILPAYGPDDLARAMKECDYQLQYRLYLQALSRWLKRSLGPAFEVSRDLAGVYYLFVRGMSSTADRDGIFFHRPLESDWQA